MRQKIGETDQRHDRETALEKPGQIKLHGREPTRGRQGAHAPGQLPVRGTVPSLLPPAMHGAVVVSEEMFPKIERVCVGQHRQAELTDNWLELRKRNILRP